MLIRIKQNLLLIIILVLAICIRSYQLGSTPALNPDEAAIGYNAYSLILTGKDEHGISWPLHFKSFGDYKPGGYFYLVLPFVEFLGLNVLSVRLPNLILSLLTILFLYKLVFLLTGKKRLALLSAFALSVSPWHIHFSRGGWESGAALGFITIGLYYFFKSLKFKFLLNFSLFVVFFVASLYIYHSARIVAPILALGLILFHFKTLLKQFPKILIPIVLGFLLLLPVAFSFLNSGGAARFSGVGLTADQGPLWRSNELLNQHPQFTIYDRIIHNKRVLYLVSWGQKYVSHFDFNFLFVNGDEVPRSKTPEMGQLYLIELPFILIGILALLKFRNSLSFSFFIIFFTLVAPLASSLTFQAPSALRSLPLVIPFSILVALGIDTVISTVSLLKKKIVAISALILIIAAYVFSLLYYLDSYFIHYPKRFPFAWQYGFNELVPFIESQRSAYKSVHITDKYDQPYVLYLFFSKYTPQIIQSEIQLTPPDNFGFSTVRRFNNLNFQKIDWSQIPADSLVVASDEIVPSTPFKIINFPNGHPAFKIYKK